MWGLLALVIGFLYGWLKPGVQDKGEILARGLIIGLIVGLVLALVGYGIGSNPVYYGTGFLGIFLGVVIITLLFILGAWIGDLIEGKPKRTT
jgi:hypothetical protein